MTAFAEWQPRYAEHGVATFPVLGKKPCVTRYLQIGHGASAQLAMKFPDSEAFGFALGARSRITVLDIDTPDERVLADALNRHGPTPVIVRSGSGHFHLWYRHNGERRRIRPDPRTPVDILGGGFAVAPPSKATRGCYSFIQGGLDDLDRLPALRGIEARLPSLPNPGRARIAEGRRNIELWKHCMRQARNCDDLDALIDVARTYNERFDPPLDDTEVIKVAASAWKKEKAGENWFGGTIDKADDFIGDEDAFFLLKFLRQVHGADREFMIANGLAGRLHWQVRRLAATRNRLIASGHIERVRQPCQHQPALFRFL